VPDLKDGSKGHLVSLKSVRARAGAHRTRYFALLASLLAIIAILLALVFSSVQGSLPGADSRVSSRTSWLSGASGVGVASGQYGAWRGQPVQIAVTWADNNEAMTQLPQLQRGGEYGSWQESLDIAIGAIGEGESWARAAQGSYDARWRQALGQLKTSWGSRPGTLYIRFAHEMNGNWYPWAVDAGEKDTFIAGWKRFRALQQEVFPTSQLVFSVNRESVDSGFDWRKSFPGASYVDVIGVDYYNQHPFVGTPADWDSAVNESDSYGAPKGLQAHLAFAASVGLPLAVPEWSGLATNGDSPVYIREMHDFFRDHAGSGPGQLLYEAQFNVDIDDGQYLLFNKHLRMPASAKEYQRLW
jgi:hypothetical protein